MMPEHRHAGLAEQVDRAGRVDQRQVLRGRDDHRAVGQHFLDQRQLHVAGAGRQVDEDDFGVAPFALDQLGQRAPRHRPAPRQRLPGGDELPDRQQPHPVRLDRNQFLLLGQRPLVGAEQGRLRRTVNVGVDHPDALAHPRQRDREVGRQRRLADPALARSDRDDLSFGPRHGQRDPHLGDAGDGQRRRLEPCLERGALVRPEPARVDDQRGDVSLELARADPRGVGMARQIGKQFVVGHGRAHNRLFDQRHCFSARALPIDRDMNIFPGLGARARALFADRKGPWGPSGGDEPPGEPPSNSGGPWNEPPRRRRPDPPVFGNVTSLDEFLRKGRARFGGNGGGGGGLASGPNRSFFMWAIIGLLAAWLIFTTMHRVAPEERGVVTRLGRYSHTLGPGIGFTLPAPFDRVQKIDVENIRTIDLGSATSETLMLTSDQNIIDIAYSVRWNIRDPELYLFEIAQPDETVQEVAESAMRAVISGVTLNDAIGEKRGAIEAQVAESMQSVLDSYRAGRADPGHRDQAGRSACRGQ